jgi:dihydrofolate reductase
VCIIGGGQIYEKLLPLCGRVYLTRIFKEYDNVDTYFPNLDELNEWSMTESSATQDYRGLKY